MPTILPKYAMSRGFKFDYYVNSDLSEYDAFFVNSKGVIEDLKEAGAKKTLLHCIMQQTQIFLPL
ncbi:hypothetical protein [Methanosarcina barkeri]|uniref:hypothetical protein n=1 Tax=Methanosarcina barkeri TaxID=2208 RepID=UPI001FB509ED|nr:hypothetical protein [Methanosarcina barkeri]